MEMSAYTRLASDGHSFEIFLDGIIQRGGGGYVRYLGLETILTRIDGYLAEQNSRSR